MQPPEHAFHAHLDRVLITQDAIRRRIGELGAEIDRDLEGAGEVTILVILQGSILFASDLMRALSLPVYLECLRVSSYHGGTASTGSVSMEVADLSALRDKHVLIVDDILDSGRTLHTVARRLREELDVRSLRTCVLLDKMVPRAVEFRPDYVGFEIENAFVVGYGLDYQGRYRNLPCIGTLAPCWIEKG